MVFLTAFLRDETGQVTIEWVGLTAGILLVGIAVVWSIFGRGVEPLTVEINGQLTTHYEEIEIPDTPSFE